MSADLDGHARARTQMAHPRSWLESWLTTSCLYPSGHCMPSVLQAVFGLRVFASHHQDVTLLNLHIVKLCRCSVHSRLWLRRWFMLRDRDWSKRVWELRFEDAAQ